MTGSNLWRLHGDVRQVLAALAAELLTLLTRRGALRTDDYECASALRTKLSAGFVFMAALGAIHRVITPSRAIDRILTEEFLIVSTHWIVCM